MARYKTTIRTEQSVEDAFAYMADVRNFAEWDPGVSSSRLVVGDEPGAGAEYDVRVSGTTLRYVTREFDGPHRTVVEAKSFLLHSYDIITVTATDDGCTVSYDAELKLNGLLGLADPFVGCAFRWIGDRAAAGMATALSGEKVVA